MSKQAVLAKLGLLWNMAETIQDLVQETESMLLEDETKALKRAKALKNAGKKTLKTIRET